ncbi:MAG TPA: ATP-binding cassette domain-containing protein [Thermoanaerobaculia bacterium]|nr:ATP-binding cassette domain-containing protein [Thermoanaerobaculia bacterium]
MRSGPDSRTPAIRVDRLAKRYGFVQAIRDLSLEVFSGEIFGFLGLNGAGKTTTLRILLDLTAAPAGSSASTARRAAWRCDDASDTCRESSPSTRT